MSAVAVVDVAEAPTPALAAVSRGDEAWWTGDRGTAVRAYREAIALAGDGPEGRAAEAMARLRLMHLGGNLAPLWHEPRVDAALADCPREEPWCVLALADQLLFLPAFTGADPARVAPLLECSPLSGPAAARRVAAGAPLDALDGVPLDGMGRGIRESGRRLPAGPGTWVLAVGVGAAPGAGVGGLVRFVHPDLAWRGHRLEASAAADSRGGGLLSLQLTTATAVPLQLSTLAARQVGDVWAGGSATPYDVTTLRAAAGVAPRLGPWTVQGGAAARSDDGLLAAGPYAALAVGDDVRLRLGVEAGFGDYTHLGVSGEVRARAELLGGTLAARALGQAVPTDSPFFRLPYAGGSDLLRGLPAGRYRGEALAGAQLEYRHAIWGPVHAAAFVDGAAVEGLHATVGAGLRLVLPPERDNVTRLDVGYGEGQWGVVLAWGEAF